MGNIFSICKDENRGVSQKKRQPNNGEYRTLQIDDKIYIVFENKENGEYFEI